jgi:metal-dependent amidase/aminoacylase/carboxypeptidase family protein
MNEDWRKKAHAEIQNLCEVTARKMGGKCEVDIQQGYPMLINDVEVTRKSMDFAREYLDPSAIQLLEPQMTAEDFAYFAAKVPATMYRLGTGGKEGELSAPLHSPYFKADEEALKTGMGLLSWLTLCFLGET